MLTQQIEGEYLTAANVQQEAEEEILSKSNVQGVAVGHKISDGRETGDVGVVVYVSNKMEPELLSEEDIVPPEINNVKVDVVESGYILALGTVTAEQPISRQEIGTQTLRERVRPVEGGYSVGHFQITAGTYATAVTDSVPFPGVPPRFYVLSNNHVLANSNNANLGDPILQPGPFDGGVLPDDQIARLSRFVPIYFDGTCNFVDAAIAEGPFHVLDREIYWIGYVQGVADAQVGMIVQKTGRTTNYSTGIVTAINGTFDVNYGGGLVARMCRQIVTTNVSAGGDSGSLLCDLNRNAVGLLFAGSPFLTLHNHIGLVQGLLGIRIV